MILNKAKEETWLWKYWHLIETGEVIAGQELKLSLIHI